MPSVRLPVPVRQILDESIDDRQLAQIWGRVAMARGNRAVPVGRAWAVALASAAVTAVLAALLLRPAAPAPLRLADGREIPALMAIGARVHLSFDDSSKLDVDAGTHLDLLESTGRAFAMAIRGGTMLVDVQPGGPRLWRIECGPVVVEVVGTRFRVERTSRFVRVAVDRGAVLVRGDPVPDRVVRVSAGQSILVPLPGFSPNSPVIASTSDRAPVANDMNTSAPPGAQPPIGESGDRSRGVPVITPGGTSPGVGSAISATTGASPAPTSSVGAFPAEEPPTVPLSSVDTGLAKADTLRRSGHFVEAAHVLELVLSEHGDDVNAPVAEFSLGRLYLDSLGNPGLSVAHFARAIARGLPTALVEDAQARLVEASARAGDVRGARDAAATYRALFPNGRRSSDVDRWSAFTP